jgi:hypothetical protein
MAGPRRRNWVLIAGLVRDEQAFADQLNEVVGWRDKQWIEGIIYSTWIGELSKYPAIANIISKHGIALVELAEPNLRLEGHVLHQMSALHYGLQLIPHDAYVFRSRPDMRISQEMRDFMKNEPSLALGPPDDWPAIFEERLVVLAGSLLSPFYINDMIFYGRKSDVKKLISFDVTPEMIYAHTAAEHFFFTKPFCDRLPIFQSYFAVNPPYAYDDPEWARRIILQQMDSNFFLQVWLTYLLCLGRYFRISFDEQSRIRASSELALLRDVSLSDILLRTETVPCVNFHPATHLPTIENETCVSAVLNGIFREDSYTTRIAADLPTVRNWSFQEDWDANALRVPKSVRDFVQAVEAIRPRRARIDELDDAQKLRFRVGWTGHRWRVIGEDAVQTLTAEINQLRRTNDGLREQIAAGSDRRE